jgi:hypothetical protein
VGRVLPNRKALNASALREPMPGSSGKGQFTTLVR